MKRIKTGADKLVEIIQNTKKISLDDAAKLLGVNKSLVQEWAEFLEKEKLISIDYSFSKVFFTERKLSATEIKKSAKDVVFEKDAFIRKVEFALASLESDSVSFEEVKKKFDVVHGSVSSEIKSVEKALSDLEKYNRLKSDVDKEIDAQISKYKKLVAEISDKIKKRDSEFGDIYSKLLKEKEGIIAHKEKIFHLQGSHKEISDFIVSAHESLAKLKDELRKEDSALSDKLKSFDKLGKDFDSLSNKVFEEKKKSIGIISSLFDKESSKLLEKQNALLSEAHAKVSKLDSYEALGRKLKTSFEGFFNKTIAISKKIEEIDLDKSELRNNLINLESKAKALNLMKTNDDLKKQAQEIEAEIKKQESSKKKLLGKIRSLLDDLKL